MYTWSQFLKNSEQLSYFIDKQSLSRLTDFRDFPSDPVTKILSSQCSGGWVLSLVREHSSVQSLSHIRPFATP